jgi:DNA-binding transcriptional MerR regulator
MEEYTIQELSDLSGVARRTIHFYTQQGILPTPRGAGLSTRYLPEHLVRLKLIPFLRSRSLRLDQIRTFLNEQDPGELQQLLAEEQAGHLSPVPPAPAPAAQGINGVVYHLPYGLILVVPAETAVKDAARIAEITKFIHEKLKDRDRHDSNVSN